jgi:hypothetical protein
MQGVGDYDDEQEKIMSRSTDLLQEVFSHSGPYKLDLEKWERTQMARFQPSVVNMVRRELQAGGGVVWVGNVFSGGNAEVFGKKEDGDRNWSSVNQSLPVVVSVEFLIPA